MANIINFKHDFFAFSVVLGLTNRPTCAHFHPMQRTTTRFFMKWNKVNFFSLRKARTGGGCEVITFTNVVTVLLLEKS